MSSKLKVVALAGGVGGAKLADGLAQELSGEKLTVIVNTGDDFELFGLKICPDLDTVCYTLAGLANSTTGWGRSAESWNALDCIEQLGGPKWFQLGDRDLGLHLERTRRLKEGQALSAITENFSAIWGIKARVIPMSDDAMPTWVYTDEGRLPFQEYFVHRQCRPRVEGFLFEGSESARPAPGVLEAIRLADLVLICPSNPLVSIDPILNVPGIRDAMLDHAVLAVSPIIGGQAVKGPVAKMYAELGFSPSALTVALHYGDLLDGFVLDTIDAAQAEPLKENGIKPYITGILMEENQDRRRLAREVLEFGTEFIKAS